MYCKYCGNPLPENSNFCTACGKVTDDINEQINDQAQKTEIVDPDREDKNDRGGSILKFAILGLAFSTTFWLSPLGLIFAIVSRIKVNSYIEMYGETEGRATVGNHLGRVAFIVNIVFCALLTLVCFILFAGMLIGIANS